MLDLLFKVIALGIGSTISPVVFGLILALLAGKYPEKRSLAFILGAVLSAIIVILAGYEIGIHGIPGVAFSNELAYVDVGLGVLFVFFGILSLTSKMEKAKISVHSSNIFRWFAIGFVIDITNFDAVLLLFTESKEIFQSGVLPIYKILLAVLGALFYLLPALLPFIVYLMMKEKAEKILKPLGTAMKKYGKYLAFAIFMIFGIYMLYRGLMLL